MKVFYSLFFLTILSFTSFSGFAQNNPQAREGFLFPFGYKFQLPGGDVGERFGWNSVVMGGIYKKNKNNWMFGGEGGFRFGDKIKDNSLLESYVFNSTGNITGSDGLPADVFFYQRGISASLRVGKIIAPFPKKPDTGILLQFGGGFLQHKIYIDERGNAVPHLQGHYATGIDRLTNGPTLVQQVSFIYLDKRRLQNFIVGIELTEAFTKNRRSYNYDEMRADTDLHFDFYLSFKLNWILPVYSKSSDYFYN